MHMSASLHKEYADKVTTSNVARRRSHLGCAEALDGGLEYSESVDLA